MSLVAVNTYAERMPDGQIVVWLVISQQTGEVFALTLDPADADRLGEAVSDAVRQAAVLAGGSPNVAPPVAVVEALNAILSEET